MANASGQKKEKLKVFAGRYAYSKPLGRGAGGAVYLAHDLHRARRPVALKVLTPEAYQTVQGKMLRREFEILSRLDHQNLVHVYDYGRLPDGGVYLAEEYIDGFSLQDARALLEPDALVDVTMQILRGLAYLHGMGMIHRDIKPANVMLLWLDDVSADPMVKLVDFGLSSSDPKSDTLRGGTRSYMAPEIIRGEKGEPRSDLFSLGVTLYYALCGVLPFGPRSKNDPPPTEEDFRPPEPHRLHAGVPLPLSRFTMALLRQLPDVDFRDAGEALQALARDTTDQMVAKGGFANKMDVAAPHILRGYFERGVVAEQADELEHLKHTLTQDGRRNPGDLYLITGEAGVGKSRLIRDTEAACKLRGRLVITAECEQGMPSWGLMTQLLERILERSRHRGFATLEEWRAQLALLRLFGRLRFGADEPVIKLQRRWIRQAFKDASKFMEEDQPLLVVEDLHLADTPSLELLVELFDRGASHSLDLIAAATNDPTLDRFRHASRAVELEQAGLTEEDVRVLFVDRLGLDLDAAWLTELAQRAKGRPAYLEEVLRQLVDGGLLWREEPGRWCVDEGGLVMFQIPTGLRESLRRRMGALGAAGREPLEVLTILERRVAWTQLRELVVAGGEKPDEVDDAIHTLLWRHLLLVDMEMNGRFVRLVDPALGQAIEGMINPEWRRGLHRRIGAVLGKSWLAHGGDALEVVRHLKAGKTKEQLALFEWACGEECTGRREHTLAQGHFEGALALVDSPPDHALLQLERARAALARFDRDSCDEALTRAMEVGERTSMDWLLFHTLTSSAEMMIRLGVIESGQQWLAQIPDLLPIMAQQPRYRELQASVDAAYGRLDDAMRGLEAAQQRYAHFGNNEGVLRCVSSMAELLGQRGDTERAGGCLQEAYNLARQHDLRDQLGVALYVHARLVRLGNELDKARRLLADALEAIQQEDDATMWLYVVLELAALAIQTGDLVEAEAHLIEGRALAALLRHEPLTQLVEILYLEVQLRRGMGDEERLVGELLRCGQALEALPSYIHLQARGLHRIGKALARHGDAERGEALLARARELGEQLGVMHLFALA